MVDQLVCSLLFAAGSGRFAGLRLGEDLFFSGEAVFELATRCGACLDKADHAWVESETVGLGPHSGARSHAGVGSEDVDRRVLVFRGGRYVDENRDPVGACAERGRCC